MRSSTLDGVGRKKKSPRSALKMSETFAAKVRRLAHAAKMDPGDWLEREFSAVVDEKHKQLLRDLLKSEK